MAALAAGQGAHAADQPVYAPQPAWVKALPVPKPSTAPESGPVKTLLYAEQTRMTPEVDEYFYDFASQILSPQGLAALGNLQITWDPATETLVIHRLHILRGDQIIDLLSGGRKFAVIQRETNLDQAMLDGRLTATFQPEGLQVGDVVDLAYTLEQRDPALKGYSTHFAGLGHAGVASRVYFRTIWPSALPIQWKEAQGLRPPVTNISGGMTEVVVDELDIETPKPPVSAPARFGDLGNIVFSQYRDWAELSGLFAPLYDKTAVIKPGSPLKAEAARIAAANRDPRARALAALRLVEDQVRYVYLGMNDGGLTPADAEVTWSRRFGDCKGKTVLLVALLRELGIEAEPALVNSSGGDGLDARLPMVGWFDHAIVRARIAGKTYWFDGTRSGDRNLDSLVVPAWGWALPLAAGGVPLEKLVPQPLTEPTSDESTTIDASGGITAPAKTRITWLYRSELAVAVRATLASTPRADYERALREAMGKRSSWFKVDAIDIREETSADAVRITFDGTAKLDWTHFSDGDVYRVPGTNFGGQVASRQPGFNADAPYLVPYPAYNHVSWRIVLPFGPRYSLIGQDIDRTVAGLALKRTERIDAGVLTVDITLRALAPEYPASEADDAAQTWRDLSRRDVAVVLPPATTAPALVTSIPTVTAKPLTGRPAPALNIAPAPPARTSSPAPASAANSPSAVTAYAETALGLVSDKAGAAKGDAAAQYRLSQRLAHGDGIEKDPAQAMSWLQKAAAAGNPDAEVALAEAYASGRGVPADTGKALALVRSAADHGAAAGQRRLGEAYLRGEGLRMDLAMAVSWLQKAADQGDVEARRELEQIAPSGSASTTAAKQQP
ncbi:DUF3857 domain-containing protein [Phenylobacterium sp.]|uniref:DUF3857 domain-containing protein n=1 Tax=Phenylobacterium sp. TaxID=1871053 RepID=UPI0025EC98CD|nr:DUF3857 domain-containing protein [Phenylobacterium sp.]